MSYGEDTTTYLFSQQFSAQIHAIPFSLFLCVAQNGLQMLGEWGGAQRNLWSSIPKWVYTFRTVL